MRRHKAKPLHWHFLTRSVLVSLIVLCATLVALAQLTSFHFTHNKLTRSIELARAIDSIAMTAATPEHIQQFVAGSMLEDRDITVRIIDKESLTLIASNRPAEYLAPLSAINDPETVSLVNHAMRTGRFNADTILSSGRHLTLLPLTSARHALAGKFILHHASTLTPDWHRNLQPGAVHISSWLLQLFQKHHHLQNAEFYTPRHKFSGVIVVENTKSWNASLTSGAFTGIALLICIGFVISMASVWITCQLHVLGPIKALSALVKRQRQGDTAARAGRYSSMEFDTLARQWNSLLNYRQSAEERHRVLSKVLEHAPIGIEVTNHDGRIEYANPAYLGMTGYSLVEVLGKLPEDLLLAKDADPKLVSAAKTAVRNGRDWHGEHPAQTKDGTEFINEVSLHPIMSEDGELERAIAVRQDVTDRRAYEASLIEARRASEEAEKSKSEFIARMSHELRTPFNSIIGFADIIAKQQLGPVGNDTYLEFARTIEQSAKGLLAIINSIIDLSRLSAGKRSLDEIKVDLVAMAQSVVRANTQNSTEGTPAVSIHDRLKGYTVQADERLLDQMMSNLVSNAIKFNRPDGSVDITLRRDRLNRIVIEIQDTGIGIPKTELENAFKPFIQLHKTGYDREHEGIGLGLTLAENQAAVHDAELKITSRENRGTTVKVIFPSYRTVKPGRRKNNSNANSAQTSNQANAA